MASNRHAKSCWAGQWCKLHRHSRLLRYLESTLSLVSEPQSHLRPCAPAIAVQLRHRHADDAARPAECPRAALSPGLICSGGLELRMQLRGKLLQCLARNQRLRESWSDAERQPSCNVLPEVRSSHTAHTGLRCQSMIIR